nr:XRE family transcriptional regulator [uncultured Oscillibacter sp.]
MDHRRKDVSVVIVKKLCNGFGISIPEFFNAPIFENLEHEIR